MTAKNDHIFRLTSVGVFRTPSVELITRDPDGKEIRSEEITADDVALAYNVIADYDRRLGQARSALSKVFAWMDAGAMAEFMGTVEQSVIEALDATKPGQGLKQASDVKAPDPGYLDSDEAQEIRRQIERMSDVVIRQDRDFPDILTWYDRPHETHDVDQFAMIKDVDGRTYDVIEVGVSSYRGQSFILFQVLDQLQSPSWSWSGMIPYDEEMFDRLIPLCQTKAEAAVAIYNLIDREVAGVVIHYHGLKRNGYRTRRHVRKVRNCQPIGDPQNSPPVVGSMDPRDISWANGRTWQLWKGEARIAGSYAVVWGWSFDGTIPLIWGLDTTGDMVGKTAARISAWEWLRVPDKRTSDGTMKRWNVRHQPGARLVQKNLGRDYFDSDRQGDL